MPVLAGRGCARVEIRSPQTRASLPDFVNKVLLGHGGARCRVQGLPRGGCRGRRRGPAPQGRASPALGAGGAPPLPPSEDGQKARFSEVAGAGRECAAKAILTGRAATWCRGSRPPPGVPPQVCSPICDFTRSLDCSLRQRSGERGQLPRDGQRPLGRQEGTARPPCRFLVRPSRERNSHQ